VESTPGATKKHLQLRAATNTKQIAIDHRTMGIADRRSGDIEPNCHARMAAKRRNSVTNSPNPLEEIPVRAIEALNGKADAAHAVDNTVCIPAGIHSAETDRVAKREQNKESRADPVKEGRGHFCVRELHS
jgi:hypothetical protein